MTVQEDVIEVRPEILQLLEQFDAPNARKHGSARSLCMLKKNAKKRSRRFGEESKASEVPVEVPASF